MGVADLNRRTALQVFVAGGSAALLAGCGASGSAPASSPSGSGTQAGAENISVTDQRGKTLTFAQPVTRVVTIPMPAASLLVAVDRSADHLARHAQRVVGGDARRHHGHHVSPRPGPAA